MLKSPSVWVKDGTFALPGTNREVDGMVNWKTIFLYNLVDFPLPC